MRAWMSGALLAALLLADGTLVQGQTQAGSELAALLAAPVDLAAFKTKKGSSNSGAFQAPAWMARPAGVTGFFYQYMLFPSPVRYSEGERFGGFSLVVFKRGKTVGNYSDHKSETLAALWCALDDPDLGKANLVGRAGKEEVKARFGEPFAMVGAAGDVWVYQDRAGRALALHFDQQGRVDWFKWARLKQRAAAPGAIPEGLVRHGSEW